MKNGVPILNSSYEKIVFGTDIGTWEWNVQTGETRFNEKWAEIIGYSLADLGKTNIDTWMQFAHPDDLEESGRLLNEHFEGKSDTYICEARMKHRDGHWVWVLDKGRVITRLADGSPEWMAGSHQEITERKSNELLLVRYKELLEKTNKAVLIGHWEVNLNEDTIFWSEVTRQIHEVDPSYEPNLTEAIDFYPEGVNRDKVSQHFQAAVEHGKSYDLELQILTKTNKLKWVRAVGIPENSGKPSQIVYGLFQDIDQHVKDQKAIEFQEEQFRKTFEYAAIGMALVGLDGKWLRVNPKVCEMLGYSKEDIYTKNFQEITHPEDLDKDLHLLNEMLAGTRDSYQIEKRYFHKKGHLVWVILSVSLVKSDKGRPIHFVSQINDITNRKKAEEETRKLLAVTKEQNDRLLNFAHIVSHNLRSHSGNISMILDLIGVTMPEMVENEYFDNALSASRKLNDTVAHLNDVAQMNIEISNKLEPLNLSKYVSDAMVTVNAQLIKSEATLESSIPEDINVLCVPAYLESILLNFFTNALKYKSDKRKPEIRISASVENDFCKITISDNGMGIDLEQHRAKLFGMYKTFHRHKDSRGIGLFITKNQIEAMGGQVEVESVVDSGTDFFVYLKHEKD